MTGFTLPFASTLPKLISLVTHQGTDQVEAGFYTLLRISQPLDNEMLKSCAASKFLRNGIIFIFFPMP